MINKFSVLLSVYKNENPIFLNDSLESIFNQTILPTEVILIRDGKLNSSLENVIVKFKNIYPNIFKIFGYEINMGLGYALNFGVNYCSYEIIFRMDTDDIAKSNRFQRQLKMLNENKELAIVGSFIEEFDFLPGDFNRTRKVPLSSKDINKFKLSKNPFNHMTVAFRKSLINEVGGFKDMPGYEDYYLWIRLLEKYDGININESLVFARVGNNMINRRQGYNLFKRELNFQKTLLNDGFQNRLMFIKNLIIRGIPRLLPKKILFLIYKYLLRS